MLKLLKGYYHKAKYSWNSEKRNSIAVLNINQTVSLMKDKGYSVARFGDGEFDMVFNYVFGRVKRKSGFQNYDPSLAKRLYEILKEGGDDAIKFKVGLPGCMLSVGTDHMVKGSANFWHKYSNRHINKLLAVVPADKTYVDATFSRFYLSFKDKSICREYIERVKEIWKDRDVLIVEGESTRLGVGNDLFYGARSVRRILAPATNAWERYDDILNEVFLQAKNTQERPIVLSALGMTATVLAYDLAKAGFQSIDVGHIDIEYEWMLMGTIQKVAVPGKFTNERKDGKSPAPCTDPVYLSQIVSKIVS